MPTTSNVEDFIIPSTNWHKTVERDSRGRSINVYTDEHGWKVVQSKRYVGDGADQRRSNQPKIAYNIVDATGRQRPDITGTVKDGKRQVERRRAYDAMHAGEGQR